MTGNKNIRIILWKWHYIHNNNSLRRTPNHYVLSQWDINLYVFQQKYINLDETPFADDSLHT